MLGHPICHRNCYQDLRQTALVRGEGGQFPGALRRLLMAISVAIFMADFTLAAPHPPSGDDQTVAKVVDEFFASQPGYEPGDLITRSQIEKVVAKLVSDGVQISEPQNIVKLGLADESFIVRELSTPNGKRFMRKIAPRQGAFSHLDRLSTIPRGQTVIRDLIRTKDGDKMIEYLATTKGGRNMGDMMAQVRGGVDLNKPTGRIYTADELETAIKGAIKKP